MDPNSNEWLEWRDNSIGSSEAGIIMGVSEYSTPYKLWLERTGREEVDQEKFAFFLGHKFEPVLREKAEQRLGEIFEPANVNSEEHPFMHASLDGRNFDGNRIMEIKLNNNDVHKMVIAKNAIPMLHQYQMQHGLLVTGAKMCYYVSGPFTDEPEELNPDDLVIVEILPSKIMQQDLLEREGAFVECLANDTPPELVDADGVQMKSATWKRNVNEWLKYEKQIKALKDKQKQSANRLKEISSPHQIARGYGVCVKNTLNKGNVAYTKVPELKGVNLNPYRGKSYIRTTIGVDK